MIRPEDEVYSVQLIILFVGFHFIILHVSSFKSTKTIHVLIGFCSFIAVLFENKKQTHCCFEDSSEHYMAHCDLPIYYCLWQRIQKFSNMSHQCQIDHLVNSVPAI